VRKAGGRVRITAQLIEGGTGGQIWAERYDRDLNDIFALQDEISEAIVTALKLKLLPEERKAIEQRGTDNVEAYNLYLMARQHYATGNEYDVRRNEAIIRLCRRATEIDPNYARAWAPMALGQMLVRFTHGGQGDDGMAAAERALALDRNLAEAHAVKARILSEGGRHDDASSEIDVALRLDPESYEVNRAAAYLRFRQKRLPDAIHHFEKALTLMETDVSSANMLMTCYLGIGAGAAMGFCCYALALLGQAESAKGWMSRAMLIDPDNTNMRYNFACALTTHLNDVDGAIELLGRPRRNPFPVFGLFAPKRALLRAEDSRVDGSIPSLHQRSCAPRSALSISRSDVGGTPSGCAPGGRTTRRRTLACWSKIRRLRRARTA
jgi:adenylate cyclase